MVSYEEFARRIRSYRLGLSNDDIDWIITAGEEREKQGQPYTTKNDTHYNVWCVYKAIGVVE
jgi:hypothetical protein